MARHVTIIGAGIGGLALACLLAEDGYEVTVYEKAAAAGGRAGQRVIEGFTFDTGPSWYLMPSVFEHFYELMGESLADHLTLERLTPAYKVFFEEQPPVVITGDIDHDSATFEAIEPGAGASLRRYVTKSDATYQLALKRFLYSNFERLSDFLQPDILRQLWRLPQLLVQPIDRYIARFVRDRRLQQILQYPMVFLGTSPFRAPAMYSLMSALDFKEGVFYPQGGMYTIVQSLEALARRRGVRFEYGAAVTDIVCADGRAQSITLASGTMVPVDILVSNGDVHHTETALLPPRYQSFGESYWAKKQASPSALLLYMGIEGKIPEFEHHSLLFVDAWRENFAAMYDTKQPPEAASLYISKTSHTDPSVAPEGQENIFVLVPLPAGVMLDDGTTQHLAEHYLKQIHRMTGVDLATRQITREIFGPHDFLTQYHSWQGSMLGQSHVLRQSAFWRTPNKSKKLSNLYYVGGSTTPGIGVPMCLISAELVLKRLRGDKRGGPLPAPLKEGRS